MRRYILDNALMWLRDFHVDGLRLDAVHAWPTSPPVHLLEEMAVEVAARCPRFVGRAAERSPRSPTNHRRCHAAEARGYGLDAQWSDDFHHALHVAPDGRDERLLRRLRAWARPEEGVREGVSIHDGTLVVVPRARPRRAHRHRGDAGVAGSSSATRTTTRSATAPRGDRDSEALDVDQLCAVGAGHAGRTVHADAVHGRGVGAPRAVPVLHLPPGARAGRATAEGRITEFARMGWDPRGPGSAGLRTFDALQAGLVRASTGGHAVVWTPTGSSPRCAAPGRRSPTRRSPHVACTADEETRVLTMRRGELLVAVNFGPSRSRSPWRAYDEVLFETPAGVTLRARPLALPPHAGCLLGPEEARSRLGVASGQPSRGGWFGGPHPGPAGYSAQSPRPAAGPRS